MTILVKYLLNIKVGEPPMLTRPAATSTEAEQKEQKEQKEVILEIPCGGGLQQFYFKFTEPLPADFEIFAYWKKGKYVLDFDQVKWKRV